jgi:hypothetical protein
MSNREKHINKLGIRDYLAANFSKMDNLGLVQKFLDWGKTLGATIKPTILKELRPYNMNALDIMAVHYKDKWQHIEKNYLAILIPAYKELAIADILSDITTQLGKLSSGESPTIKNAEIIIAINGEGKNPRKSSTFLAVSKFIETQIKPNPRIKITPLLVDKQGKLPAYDTALEYLELGQKQPGELMFFDADYRQKDGCLKSLHDGLADSSASSVGIEINDIDMNKFSKTVSRLTLQRRQNNHQTSMLQGGAFAIKSELAPLYHAFVRAFPGTFANDFNWTNILKVKNIPIHIDQERLSIVTPSNNFWQLLSQHDRWLKGVRQASGFIENLGQIMGISVSKETKIRFLEYFPNFPRITSNQIWEFGKGLLTQELPVDLYFLFLFMAVDIFPSAKSITHDKKIGGPPPNIFLPVSWIPPRK